MVTNSVLPSPEEGKVFVVHGHSNEMKEAAARTIEKLGLEVVILHEQPSCNQTLIEKFEKYAAVTFAVVLFSGDDMAYPVSNPEAKPKPRARQNVVLELGYFIGKLGRERVFTLFKEAPEFEQPSDYLGVVWTAYDAAGAWKLTLARELAAAGYQVNVASLFPDKKQQLEGKVESPKEGETLPPGYCEVTGRVTNYSGQLLYVMTGKDDTYWPSGRIIPQADMTWSSSVNFGKLIDKHTIYLVAVDENTATLLDLYRQNASSEKRWNGVRIRSLQRVLSRVEVRTDLSQEIRKTPSPGI